MERRVYRGMLGLLLLALGVFVWSAWTRGAHGVVFEARFHRWAFTAVMLASIPGTMLLMAGLRLVLGASAGGRMFWIKHPARTVLRETDEDVAVILQRAEARLAALGFTVVPGDASGATRRLVFSKPKLPKVERFVDHPLQGELEVQRDHGRTRAAATLIFQDIIVVDSGEFERLDAIAGYILGSTEELNVPTLPFTMVCGVMIAVANAGLWPVAAARTWLVAEQFSVMFAAVAMILFGGYTIVSHRKESHGLLLGVLGLVAAITPLFAG